MVEVEVFVEAEVNPTEDEEKVRQAISNVLNRAEFSLKSSPRGGVLSAKAKGQDSLLNLRNLIRNDRIRDAARRILFKSARENVIRFCLNKQVAFAGHVSFSEEFAESPLGPLRFTVECDDVSCLVEWLAEKTTKR